MGPRYTSHWYSERHLLITPVEPREAGRLVRAFARALLEHPPESMLDLTPSAACLLLHLDPAAAIHSHTLLHQVQRVLDDLNEDGHAEEVRSLIEIPFCSTPELAPDLSSCAQHAGLSAHAFLDRFCSLTFEAAFVGFMPGFAYLSGLDPALHVPRLPTPRPRVPAGSIAIAGDMAGIYPFASPGGWQLIGKTPRVMFDPARTQPSLIEAGFRVRFTQIDPVRFESLLQEQEQSV